MYAIRSYYDPPEMGAGRGTHMRRHARQQGLQTQLFRRIVHAFADFLAADIQKAVHMLTHKGAGQCGKGDLSLAGSGGGVFGKRIKRPVHRGQCAVQLRHERLLFRCVITSYSIHYTKLYDAGHSSVQ